MAGVPYFADPTASPEEAGYLCCEACLTMMLAFLGLDEIGFALLQLVVRFTSPDKTLGTRPEAAVDAAHKFGDLESHLREFSDEGEARSLLTNQAPFIAIVTPEVLNGVPNYATWWHTVVVCGCEGDDVVFHDPDPFSPVAANHAPGSENGRNCRVSMERFLAAWRASEVETEGARFRALEIRRLPSMRT